MDAKFFLEGAWSLIQKLPLSYVIMVIVLGLGGFILTSTQTEEFLFGPKWSYLYNKEEETVVFETDTVLKSGKIVVRPQLEFKYKNQTFCILEIQGLYNTNEISLSNVLSDDEGIINESHDTKFCLTLEMQQREHLDLFVAYIEKLLEENLKKKYNDYFLAERLEVVERQIAEINYQSLRMNRSKPMYVSVSEDETSTVTKSEVIMRSPSINIDLDEMNFGESFYTNEEVTKILEDCMKEINLDL